MATYGMTITSMRAELAMPFVPVCQRAPLTIVVTALIRGMLFTFD